MVRHLKNGRDPGRARWTTNIATAAKAPMPTWGFSSAPVIVGDRLFLNANSFGIALDKNTGEADTQATQLIAVAGPLVFICGIFQPALWE